MARETLAQWKQRYEALQRITDLQVKQIQELQDEVTRLKKQNGEIKSDEQYDRLQRIVDSQKILIEQLKKKAGETERENENWVLRCENHKLRQEIEEVKKHNARGAGRKPKINQVIIDKTIKLHNDGISMQKISKQMGISKGTVFNILHS